MRRGRAGCWEDEEGKGRILGGGTKKRTGGTVRNDTLSRVGKKDVDSK